MNKHIYCIKWRRYRRTLLLKCVLYLVCIPSRSGSFFEDTRKYKHPRLKILISQGKLPLNAVCLQIKYVERRFS